MTRQNSRSNAKTEFWRTHIAQQKKSGKTEKSYCSEHALSYATFRFWKKKLEDEGGCFVQLKPETSARPPQRIEFILPGIGTLVFSEDVSCVNIAQLIRAIREMW